MVAVQALDISIHKNVLSKNFWCQRHASRRCGMAKGIHSLPGALLYDTRREPQHCAPHPQRIGIADRESASAFTVLSGGKARRLAGRHTNASP